jgi:hypothetical protein
MSVNVIMAKNDCRAVEKFFQQIGHTFSTLEKMKEALARWEEISGKNLLCVIVSELLPLEIQQKGNDGIIKCQAGKIVAVFVTT